MPKEGRMTKQSSGPLCVLLSMYPIRAEDSCAAKSR